MAKKVKMQGELEPGLLMDMLQLVNRRRNLNGYIEVTDSLVSGRIWLQEGSIIAANWKDRQGELAVESMLRLKQGMFEVGDVAALPAKTILKDTGALLMVCMRAIGRDALIPGSPARIVSPPPELKVSAPNSEVPSKPIDETMPAPAHQNPTNRPCKRGSFMAGRWSWRIAAMVCLFLILGTALIIGVRRFGVRQMPVAEQIKMVPEKPQAIPAVVLAPSSSLAVVHDGWPDIILSALAASGKNHWCAILNGQLLGVGEQVDGVTVRSIRTNGVLLEYQGQRRFMCAAKK